MIYPHPRNRTETLRMIALIDSDNPPELTIEQLMLPDHAALAGDRFRTNMPRIFLDMDVGSGCGTDVARCYLAAELCIGELRTETPHAVSVVLESAIRTMGVYVYG